MELSLENIRCMSSEVGPADSCVLQPEYASSRTVADSFPFFGGLKTL